jgi:hypothetical protein
MQTIDTSKNQEVLAVGQELDRPNWQDHYHVKLTPSDDRDFRLSSASEGPARRPPSAQPCGV